MAYNTLGEAHQMKTEKVLKRQDPFDLGAAGAFFAEPIGQIHDFWGANYPFFHRLQK
jgi:hypothetical protein